MLLTQPKSDSAIARFISYMERADAKKTAVKTKTGMAKIPGKPCGKGHISASFKCKSHYTNGKLNEEGKASAKTLAKKVRAIKGLKSIEGATKKKKGLSNKFGLSTVESAKLLPITESDDTGNNFVEIYKVRKNLAKRGIKSRKGQDAYLYKMQKEGLIDMSSLHDEGLYTRAQAKEGIMQDNGGALFFASVLPQKKPSKASDRNPPSVKAKNNVVPISKATGKKARSSKAKNKATGAKRKNLAATRSTSEQLVRQVAETDKALGAMKEVVQKVKSDRVKPSSENLKQLKKAVESKKPAKAKKGAEKLSASAPSMKGAVKVDKNKIKEKSLPKVKGQKDFEKYLKAHAADLVAQDNSDNLVDLKALQDRMTSKHGVKPSDFTKMLIEYASDTNDAALSSADYGTGFSIKTPVGRDVSFLQISKQSAFKEDPEIESWQKSKKGKLTGEVIADYSGFENAASELMSKKKGSNGNLTPIHEMRKEIGDRVTRKEFNTYLLDLQANDKVQLMGGDLPGVTRDQLKDSVAIPGAGVRFYAKDLS